MKAIDEAIATALRTSPSCKHISPDARLIYAGAAFCPYCEIQAYARTLAVYKAYHDKEMEERAAAMQKVNSLNASNTALQQLALELCQTPIDAERLRKINQEQYDNATLSSNG